MQDDELHIEDLDDSRVRHGHLLSLMRRGWNALEGRHGVRKPAVSARVVVASLTVVMALTLIGLVGDGQPQLGGAVTRGSDPVPVTASEAAPTMTIMGKAPDQVGTSDWQQIALPGLPGTSIRSMVPSPSDPSTIFACTGAAVESPAQDAPYGRILMWRSSDTGRHWSSLPLPSLQGTGCELQLAQDDPARVALLVSDGNRPLYLSDDGGDSWMGVSLPVFDLQGGTFLWYDVLPTAHHLFVATEYDTSGSQQPRMQVSSLMRSDDEGRTWIAIAQMLNGNRVFRLFPTGGEDTLVTNAVPWLMSPAPASFHATPAMWLSRDAGNTWTQMDVAAAPHSTDLVTLPIRSSELPAPIYVGMEDQIPGFLLRLKAGLLSTALRTWITLPPLPVPGATAEQAGLLQVFAETQDGRLLTFGVDPATGVPSHSFAATSQWLWLWDPRIERWLAWSSPLPVSYSWGCGVCLDNAATWATINSTPGTYLWVRDFFGRLGEANVAYRVFVPDAPPGQLGAK